MSDPGREQEHISVVARLRPSPQPSPHVRVAEKEVVVQIPRGDDVINNQVEEYGFRFARVFGPDASQRTVFDAAAKELVLGALDGVNCTIFAYGQTGSGKTYTICGNHKERGIVPRSLNAIFEALERRQGGEDFSISMSFIEVYKEVGYDLLAKEFGGSKEAWPVVSVTLPSGQPVLQGAKRVAIASEEEGLHQYFLGDTHRTVAETPHNLNSSRSHCIFTIFIEASDPGTQTIRSSKVQIVDLAGSERLKPYEAGSQNSRVLMGQAVSINLSLHMLESVINALNKKSGMVPYRNSFLTKVLKDALGGNAKAVMVATLNGTDAALPETISTCRFAQRVANVQTFSRVNEERDPQLVIAALRQENAELRAALSAEPGEALSEAELRGRARAFLEEEAPSGKGGSSLVVSSLQEAFSAFRLLRELCWEMLRRAAGAAGAVSPAGSQKSKKEVVELSDADSDIETLKRALEERDGECRALRAALAAPRPAPRPTRPAPVRARSVAAATQTDGSLRRAPKPKRPASAGADNRPRGGVRGFVGFSQEDVVDPFGRMEGAKNMTLPPLKPRADARVPDFRRPAEEAAAVPQELRRSCHSLPASEPSSTRETTKEATKETTRETTKEMTKEMKAPDSDRSGTDPPPAHAAPEKTCEISGGASRAWLAATTALAPQERQLLADPAKAYQLFLLHDPRAADIWPGELQTLRQDRRDRMEEAKALGVDIEQATAAKRQVQDALSSLREKLRQAREAAAVDPDAAQRAATLEALLTQEEPRLAQLFDEKRQRYELDFARLKELKREISHLEHAEKKLEMTVQAEFHNWKQAVTERYPEDVSAKKEDGYAPNAKVAVAPLCQDEVASASDGGEEEEEEEEAAQIQEPRAPTSEEEAALEKAERALEMLRVRLQEAEENGDESRRQTLAALLATEAPKLAARRRAMRGL